MLSVESLSVRVWMCVSFDVSECVLDNSAIAEPLTVRPLVEFIFILVNETLSVCKMKGSFAETHGGCISTKWKVFRGAGSENKKEQTWFFFFFIHSIK